MMDYFKKQENKPIAFVPMCADPIHHGHINILKVAKTYGKVVVGLMTDEAMESYKDTPLLSFEARLKVVEELRSVDLVIPSDGIDYPNMARKFKFEYFIHGDDWKYNIQSHAREELLKIMPLWGGKVIDVPYTVGISSSKLKKGL